MVPLQANLSGPTENPPLPPIKIHRYAPKLYLIELIPPLAGFEAFIGTWLYRGRRTWIVDVGPAATVSGLVKALDRLGVTTLDYILLTHIHIDHAGAIGHLAGRYPDTPIVCPPAGIPHLVDPQRLWEGSLKTLGATGQAYGPIWAVPHAQLLPADQFDHAGILPLETPGHSPHHYSYLHGEHLFSGEAGGVYLPLDHGEGYLRPATPPRFFWDTYLKSLDCLLACEPQKICYGHFGMHGEARRMLVRHRGQLHRWRELFSAPENFAPMGEAERVRCLMDALLAQDPEMRAFGRLDGMTRAREEVFLANSIRGFWGCFAA